MTARLGGQALPLGPPQRRGVLAVLAVRRRQWVSASALLDALYAESWPTSGNAVIQTHISALRRALEPDRPPRSAPTTLLSGHGGYQLRLEDDRIDVGILERLAAAAAQADRAGDGAQAAAHYAAALALFVGEPLAGIAGPWAEQQRAVLLERRLALQEDSLALAVRRGRADQAIDTLRTLTREHPLRERLQAILMQALADRGRQAEALAGYRDTRRLLVGELGVEPGAELRELHDRILRGWTPTRTEERAAEAVSPPVAERSGGNRDLTLVDAYARRGSGGLILITGRPGYGKTELLDAIARRHPEATRFDLTTPDEDLAGGLLTRLGGIGSSSDQHPGAELRAALTRRTAERPLLILIDNAAWMNERSVRALVALGPWLRDSRALLVLALDGSFWDQRNVELHSRLEPHAAEVLRLRRRSLAAIAARYRERTGLDCAPELATRIQHAAGEIPLLVDALIADLADRADPAEVPDRLLDGRYTRVTATLLQGFSARGATMLRALAALQDFDPDVRTLAAACDQPPTEVRHRCALLTEAGVLAAAEPPRVRHPLIANTIRWLGRRGEAERFQTAAAEYERGLGYPARRVARLLRDLCGSEYAEWTVVLLDAAEESLRECLFGEAVRWLELALRICPPRQRDDLLVRIGQWELWTNPAAARAHLDAALRGQRERGSAPTAAIPLAWTMAMRHEAEAAMPLLNAVIAETEARDHRYAEVLRASRWMVAGLTASTWHALITELRALPAPDRVDGAVLTWADAFAVRVDARTALRRLTPIRPVDRLPDPLLGLLAHLNMWAGDLPAAQSLTEQRTDQHFGAIDTYRAVLRSEVLLRGGAYREVLAELGPVLGDLDDELVVPPAALAAQYAHALLGLGRLAEAQRWLDVRTANADPETWEWTIALHIRGLLCAARGESREAVRHFLECGRRGTAVGLTNPAHIAWRSAAALELVRLGAHEQARELADEEFDLAQRWGTPATIGRALRAQALARSEPELLLRSVDLLRRQDDPRELMLALLDLARLRRDPAPLREARALAERIGAAGYLAEIEDLLRAAAE
ncbi:BTAD domain-containing putative transcriptional regulator [Nocardia sp. NPDC048505]|uniref:BTAD domain-containing putative transcriptional regulator n=1 Tax=unclassified Nocardia TaxID=2637762 RepID=UPI0033C68EA9